jgi:hypothetical protein
MTSVRRFGVLWLLVGLSVAAPLWAGAINTLDIACPSQGTAGGSVLCAVNLFLIPGVTVEDFTFGVEVTPNDSAPALTTGKLTFSDSIGGAFVVTLGSNNSMAVIWDPLNQELSGSSDLGSVGFLLPASATSGQSYSVTITGASGADADADNVAVAPGPASTVSIPEVGTGVPEPATGALLAMGLLALANPWAVRRRRAKRPNV